MWTVPTRSARSTRHPWGRHRASSTVGSVAAGRRHWLAQQALVACAGLAAALAVMAPAAVSGMPQAQGAPRAGTAARPAPPATAKPGAQTPAKPAMAMPVPIDPRSAQPTCEFLTVEEARPLVGLDATPITAPSKGPFTSCGYTSVPGDALTVYIADYGLPSVAQEFFDKTRESLKTTTKDDGVGLPAYSYVPVPADPTAAPALSLIALVDQKIITLEAAGPIAGQAAQLPRLRAIVQRLVNTLKTATPPPAQ